MDRVLIRPLSPFLSLSLARPPCRHIQRRSLSLSPPVFHSIHGGMINGGNMPGPLFLSGGHTRASFTLPKVSPEIQEVIEASYYLETRAVSSTDRGEWAGRHQRSFATGRKETTCRLSNGQQVYHRRIIQHVGTAGNCHRWL